MDPFATAMGVAAFGGGIWANQQSLGESKRGREFLARMSGSAYQRAVVDMRAAGLNPMLAYSQGGASTPGAPTASVGDAVGEGLSTALAARRQSQELKLMRQETASRFIENQDIKPVQKALLEAQGREARERTRLAQQEILESRARTGGHQASTARQVIETELAREGMAGAVGRATRARILQRPLDLAEALSRRLFDPRNARVTAYELSRAVRRGARNARQNLGPLVEEPIIPWGRR